MAKFFRKDTRMTTAVTPCPSVSSRGMFGILYHVVLYMNTYMLSTESC